MEVVLEPKTAAAEEEEEEGTEGKVAMVLATAQLVAMALLTVEAEEVPMAREVPLMMIAATPREDGVITMMIATALVVVVVVVVVVTLLTDMVVGEVIDMEEEEEEVTDMIDLPAEDPMTMVATPEDLAEEAEVLDLAMTGAPHHPLLLPPHLLILEVEMIATVGLLLIAMADLLLIAMEVQAHNITIDMEEDKIHNMEIGMEIDP